MTKPEPAGDAVTFSMPAMPRKEIALTSTRFSYRWRVRKAFRRDLKLVSRCPQIRLHLISLDITVGQSFLTRNVDGSRLISQKPGKIRQRRIISSARMML